MSNEGSRVSSNQESILYKVVKTILGWCRNAGRIQTTLIQTTIEYFMIISKGLDLDQGNDGKKKFRRS